MEYEVKYSEKVNTKLAEGSCPLPSVATHDKSSAFSCSRQTISCAKWYLTDSYAVGSCNITKKLLTCIWSSYTTLNLTRKCTTWYILLLYYDCSSNSTSLLLHFRRKRDLWLPMVEITSWS